MAMWSPNGFKKVLPKPDLNAEGGLPVGGAFDIEVLEELPIAPGASEAGGPPPKWLKVRAYSPDREVTQEGFMLQEWLKAIPVEYRSRGLRARLSRRRARSRHRCGIPSRFRGSGIAG